MEEIIEVIESGYERKGRLEEPGEARRLADAVGRAIALLDAGEVRVAEPSDAGWRVNQWLKKAVLLSFRLADNRVCEARTAASTTRCR